MSNTDTTTKLLQKLQNGEITLEDCQKELRSKTSDAKVNYKVSPKGCISFYGIRRMPISLYMSELVSILNAILEVNHDTGIPYNDEFRTFIADNDGKISVKEK